MKKQFLYYCSCISNSREMGYERATPIKPGPEKSSYMSGGFTQQPLVGSSLAKLLAELKKLTGVELSQPKVYREVVQQGISASVVPAWPELKNHYLRPATTAVVLISRRESAGVSQR